MVTNFNGDMKKDYTLTKQNGINAEMLMDIDISFFEGKESKTFLDNENESAFLLVNGDVTFFYNEEKLSSVRDCPLSDKPYCLHVPKGVEVTISSNSSSEVLVQKTVNEKEFAPVFYTPENVEQLVVYGEAWGGTSERILRDIFNYKNAPYSNMVMGELVHFGGKWSSYPPHHHRQPEVYYYRFKKEQGFGVSVIGNDAFVVKDRSFSAIKGGNIHPQVAAPGYPMYYCWLIRHLDNDPWTERIDCPEHMWLYDEKN